MLPFFKMVPFFYQNDPVFVTVVTVSAGTIDIQPAENKVTAK